MFDVQNTRAPPRELHSVPEGFGFGARWSPDGREFVFSGAARNGKPDLYTMNVDGTDLRRVTTTSGKDEFGDAAYHRLTASYDEASDQTFATSGRTPGDRLLDQRSSAPVQPASRR